MADPYSDLGNAAREMQERIADAMEARCLDPAQVELRERYLGPLSLPDGAFAVEFGSGTGHVTHDLMRLAGAHSALGIEPSEIMVERARSVHKDIANLSFQVGDAADTGLDAASVDLVCMHTLLIHAPEAEAIMAEAFRVLKPGAILAVLDADYDPTTVAIGPFDPLQPLVARMIEANVHDRWLTRRLAPFIANAGFRVESRQSHGYVAEGEAAYFLTVVDRGADTLAQEAVISDSTSEALKAEARRRVAEGAFFGFMSYLSVIASKPE